MAGNDPAMTRKGIRLDRRRSTPVLAAMRHARMTDGTVRPAERSPRRWLAGVGDRQPAASVSRRCNERA
ncbi:hypothetical protein C6P78_24620 [Burkholderia multivorans]|nr:hypothetical protein C6P78_24620 [Burkholderia multivorans]